MFEALFIVFAMAGAIGLAYAILGVIADYVLFPNRKPWRPQATYKRRAS